VGASVENTHIQTYESTVRHLAQQGITRLLPHVMVKSVQSEGHNWERLGTQEAVEKTSRLAATPTQDYPFSRRKSIPKTYHTGDSTEQEDIVQMLIDPNSNIAQAQGKAMRRAQDDEIIAAAVGDSRDGNGNVVPFEASQTIGDGSAVLTFDQITEVQEKFLDNDIDAEEQKVFVISPSTAKTILQMEEATSGDYNALRPLTTMGYVQGWMGFEWIVSTRLLGGADALSKYNFAMTKKALGMQLNRDVWARVAEDPTVSFAWRIYAAATWGAVRVEDEQIVRVDVR
jgi:hypothetical protein